MRSRVLFLSCHLPWPPLSGGRRRELELITRLAERFDVHLLVISKTPDQDLANAGFLDACCSTVEVFPAASSRRDTAGLDEPPQVLRHRSRAATTRVREILAADQVDLVHVEGFYLVQHVPDWIEVPMVLVEQNIEYELEHQRARAGGGGVTRLDGFLRSVRTHDAELACWRRATRLATVTAEDRATVRAELPGATVSVVPDGVDHVAARPVEPGVTSADRPDARLITLLANFGYAPNVDAARFFCGEILPEVRRAHPDVQLWLVGNAPPVEVRSLASERVEVTGYVPDVLPYLDAADVVVCPLRIGGGIKVKTIEALRRGKAVVTTGIGAQGLPPGARGAVWVEDDPIAFAHAVTTLLRDRQRRMRLERLAVRGACGMSTWDRSAEALALVYDELLDRSPSRRAVLGIGRSA